MKDGRKRVGDKIESRSHRFVKMKVNDYDDDDGKGDEMMHMVEMTGTHVSFSTF